MQIGLVFNFVATRILSPIPDDGPPAPVETMHYELEVTFDGILNYDMGNPGYGTVCLFKDLKNIVQSEVLNQIENKYLNGIVPIRPTVENLAAHIADSISTSSIYTLNVRFVELKLWDERDRFVKI